MYNMAYARVGSDSDVYVYAHSEGVICLSNHRNRGNYEATCNGCMVEHLIFEHMQKGERVPKRAIDRLASDEDMSRNMQMWPKYGHDA